MMSDIVKLNLEIQAQREENAKALAILFDNLAAKMEPVTKEIAPRLKRLFYDFGKMKKGGGGTIMGCATQDEWAQKYAGRTARALRYMFEGGNPGRHDVKKIPEQVGQESGRKSISVLSMPPLKHLSVPFPPAVSCSKENPIPQGEPIELKPVMDESVVPIKQDVVCQECIKLKELVDSERRIVAQQKGEIAELKKDRAVLLKDIPDRCFVPEWLRGEWDRLNNK